MTPTARSETKIKNGLNKPSTETNGNQNKINDMWDTVCREELEFKTRDECDE